MLGMGLGTKHSPFPLSFHYSSHFAEARRLPGRCFRGLQSGCLEAPASRSLGWRRERGFVQSTDTEFSCSQGGT